MTTAVPYEAYGTGLIRLQEAATPCRVTSLETATPRNRSVGPCLGSYGALIGGGRFLMSEVTL